MFLVSQPKSVKVVGDSVKQVVVAYKNGAYFVEN